MSEAPPPPDPDTLVVNPEATGPLLFCFSGLFADAPAILGLGRAVAGVAMRVLQPPGLDWSGIGARTVEEMAAHYCGRLERIQPTGSIHILGVCFGSYPAFATAQLLEARGRTVATLILLDSEVPRPGEKVRAGVTELSEQQLARYPFLREGLEVARTHVAAREAFRPRPGVSAPVDLVYALGPGKPPERDRRLGWAALAGAGLRFHEVDGFHDDILGSQLASVARLVRDRLGPRQLPGLGLEEFATRLPALELGVTPSGSPALVDPAGGPWPIHRRPRRGYVESVVHEAGRLFVTGWALSPLEPAPAETVLFLAGTRIAGRGRRVAGPRPDVEAALRQPDLGEPGFAGELELVDGDRPGDRPLRVFAAGSGQAFELEDLTGSAWSHAPRRFWHGLRPTEVALRLRG